MHIWGHSFHCPCPVSLTRGRAVSWAGLLPWAGLQGSPAPSQGLLSSGLGQELWDPVMECKYDGGSGEGLNSVCVCTLQNAPVTGVIYYRALTVQSTHKHQG